MDSKDLPLIKIPNDTLNVPVIGFIANTKKQFILVNKARPRNLIDELLPKLIHLCPQIVQKKIPSNVNALGRTEGSPFFGIINPSDPVEKKGILTQLL